jgi:hypothetical protein
MHMNATQLTDLACWTPLAGIIRINRRRKMNEEREIARVQRKIAHLCEKLASEYNELQQPAWT